MSSNNGVGGNLPLTKEQLEVVGNMKAIWLEFKFKTGWSQADMAKKLGFKSQSGFSQYINGTIAPNTDIVLRFARIVGVHPGEVWPEKFTTGKNRIEWTESERIAHKLELLNETDLNLVDQMIESLTRKK